MNVYKEGAEEQTGAFESQCAQAQGACNSTFQSGIQYHMQQEQIPKFG